MIRAVIFTLLALSVRAANYGHSSYLSGIPSYSSYAPSSIYGSGLLGSLYGTGHHYGSSGLHYGTGHRYGSSGLHYGSGLHHGSGLHYGSGHHYGSGVGHGYYGSGVGHGYYGSGLHYGLGGAHTLHGGHTGHLTSAIRPSIYSSRYDIHNPSGGILNRGQIISNVPGKMEFVMGEAGQKAQLGAIAAQPLAMKYARRVPYSSGAMLSGEYFANEAPAKTEIVLGGTGYKTGAAALEGHGRTAIHKYAPKIPYNTGSIFSSGVIDTDAPGKIEFVLGDSGYKTGAAAISGQTKPMVLKSSPALRRTGQTSMYGVPITDPSGTHIAFNQDFSRVSGMSGIGAQKQQNINLNKAAGLLPRYTPRVPYSSGAMLGGGYFSNEAPAKMEFVLGGTGFKTGADALEGHNKPTAFHSAGMYGVARGQSAISASRPAIRPFPKVSSPIAGATLPRYTPRVPYSSGAMLGGGYFSNEAQANMEFVLGGTGFKTGAAAVEGHNKPTTIHSAGMYGVARGQSAISANRPAIRPFPKVSSQNTGATLPRYQSRNAATAMHGGAVTGAGHGQISFNQDFSRVGGQSQAGVKPGSMSLNKLLAPNVGTTAHHGSGLDSASLHSAGIGGVSETGGHQNILSAHDVASLVAGFHSSRVNQAAPALTTGGAIKPSTRNIHRANLNRMSGAHGLTSGVADSHMTFNMGQSAMRKPGMNVASLDKVMTPAVATRPVFSSGTRGTSANIPAYGSSGLAGPAGMSFIQDFSKVIGSQTAGVQPFLSIDRKLSAPIFPSVSYSPRNQAGFRNTAGFISSSVTKPVPGALAYRAPKQPGSISSPLTGSVSQGASIFSSGPASINTAEGHAMDFKQGTSGVSEQVGGRLAGFEIAPESGYAQFDKSSFLTHSNTGAASPGGIVSGVQHSSTGVRSGSLHGSAESLSRMSGDKTSIFDGALGDKSTFHFHSTGVAGTSNALGDQGSIIELVPAGINTATSGQGMILGRSGVFPAFPSFPSSSHPGFSHVAREYGTDKSLFYSAASPNLVS